MGALLLLAGLGLVVYAATRKPAESSASGAAYVPQTPNESQPQTWQALINSFGVGSMGNKNSGYTGVLPRFGATSWTPNERSRPYLQATMDAEVRHGIPRGLLVRLIEQESMWNPRAVSHAGAVGLGQFMPATAAEWKLTDRTDPWKSIETAAKYLVWCKNYVGGWAFGVAAYNAGIGTVGRNGKNMYKVRAETVDYVNRISGSILGIDYAQAVDISRGMA